MTVTDQPSPPPSDDDQTQSTPAEGSPRTPAEVSGSGGAGDRVLSIIEDLETKFSRIRDLRQSHDTEGSTLSERAEHIDEALRAIEQREQDVNRQQAAITEARQRLNSDRDAMSNRTTDLDRERTSLEEELQSRERELVKAREDAGTLRTKTSALEQQLSDARLGSEQELHDALQIAEDADTERDVLRAQLAASTDTHAQAVRNLESTINEYRDQLAEGTADASIVEQQQQQIQRLTDELATAKLSSKPQEVEQRDERIRELTEALRQARGQTGDEIAVGAIEQENSAFKQQNDQLRLDVERLQLSLETKTAQLDDHVTSSAARHQADQDAMRQLTQEHTAVSERARQLDDELARTKSTTGTEDDLVERWNQVNDATVHLRRRFTRLRQVRLHLRARPAADSTPQRGPATEHGDALRTMHDERLAIKEAHRAMAACEQKMLRAWARPKAAIAVGWCVFALCMNVIAGWLIADNFFPAIAAATVTIEAKSRPGTKVSDEDMQLWQDWHAGIVSHDSFHTAVSKRLRDRRLEIETTPVAVHARLKNDLTVDAATGGEIVLALTGVDAQTTRLYLDVVASTLITHSKKNKSQHGGRAKTSIRGRYEENGSVRYATLNPRPVQDQRILYAGISSLIGIVLTSGLSLLFYRRLLNAKLAFDTESVFVDEDGDELVLG